MNTTSSNTVSIYDIVAHRSFCINVHDVDVTRTKKNADKWQHCYVYVYESARVKTPCHLGYFLTNNKTLKKIISKPRKQW